MHIRYVPYRPNAQAAKIIEIADVFLEDYASQGYTLTLRQLYYRFIANDLLPNCEESYKKLGTIMGKARDAGMIDWHHLEDRARHWECAPHWENPEEFMASVCPQFAIDLWENQPNRVEVWVEKDALSEVVGRAASELDVPYMACKGYISQSTIWQAGRRFLQYGMKGQDVVVIHLGDHDPSGIDMTRDLQQRLVLYSTPTKDVIDQYPNFIDDTAPSPHRVRVDVLRIALNMDQVRKYNPPPNPAKMTDSRSGSYVKKFGKMSWELDALDPATLHKLIQDTIKAQMDPKLFNMSKAVEEVHKQSLQATTDHWDDVTEFLTNNFEP